MKVDFYRHGLDPTDAEAVAAVLGTPFLTTGKVSRAVEQQLQGYFRAPHAVLVNSWTNGALALLLAIGLEPGDEVVLPAMTFIATANVVELAGGTPVFADVDPHTLLMTPELAERHITDKTRAIMPVHLYGQMCDMRGFAELQRRAEARTGRKVYLIEDCAQAFEVERDGLKPGESSDAAVFSFYATKNVTCGEGGAVVLSDPDLHGRLLETRLHGMSAIAVDRFAGGSYNHWDMHRLGTKANLPDLLAALLPKQIDTIDAKLPFRVALAERYRDAFANGPIRLVGQVEGARSAEHLFPIGVPGGMRDRAIAALNEAGIGITVNFRSVPTMQYYSARYPDAAALSPVSRQWGEETLTLPLFPGLTEAEQDHVIDSVKQLVYPLALDAKSREV